MDSMPRSVILPRWHTLNRYRGRVVSGRNGGEIAREVADERASVKEGDAHVPNVYDCAKTSEKRSIVCTYREARAKRKVSEGQPIDRLIDRFAVSRTIRSTNINRKLSKSESLTISRNEFFLLIITVYLQFLGWTFESILKINPNNWSSTITQ